MGFGDVRLAGLCGMFLGFLGWRQFGIGFISAALLAGLVAVGLVVGGKAGRKTRLPYGPFLAGGTMIGVLFGAEIAKVWLGH